MIRSNVNRVAFSVIFLMISAPASAQDVTCSGLYTAQADLDNAEMEEASYNPAMEESAAYAQRQYCELNATTSEDNWACFDEYQDTMSAIEDRIDELDRNVESAQSIVDVLEGQLAAAGIICY